MLFALPYALLGSITVAALVATYLYRSRFHKKYVSSLMLWRQTVLPTQGGVRRDTLRLPPIFYVELAILIALIVAAAAPLARRAMPHTISVVFDDSASMSAVGRDGVSSKERALRVIQGELKQSPSARVRVISAGAPEPGVVGVVHPSRVAACMGRMKCASTFDTLEAAIARAAELSGKEEGGEVIVVSDHPPAADFAVMPPVRWIAVGDATPNCGFVYADRSANPDGSESLLLEIRSFGASSAAALRLPIGKGGAGGNAGPSQIRVSLVPMKDGAVPVFSDVVALDDQGYARIAMTLPR